MRLLLAIRCFFLILFAARLPAEAAGLLPAPAAPEPPKRPPGPTPEERAAEEQAARERQLTQAAEVARARADGQSRGALQVLGLLQREGRLIDFLEEDITTYADSQIGAAVRDIHKGCKRALAEHIGVQPVLDGKDDDPIRVEPGFDASRIRLVGNVVGSPPFQGTLKHPGWRGAKVTLPELAASQDPSVIAPAEVELRARE